MSGKRNVQIQVLRGVFCICIAFYHYTARFSAIYNLSVTPLVNRASSCCVYIAMCCFCLLSGYFAVNPQKRVLSIKGTIVKRIIRLYPSYLLSITMIYIISLLFLNVLGERVISFRQFLLNIVFFNIITRTGWVDGAHWYVVFVLFITLYLNSFFIMTSFYTSNWFWWFQQICLAVFLVAMKSVNPTLVLYVVYFSMACFGASLRSIETLFGRRVCCLIELFFVTLAGQKVGNTILLIICVLITMMAIKKQLKFTEQLKVFSFIGDRSYNIYLVHQNIGYIVILTLLNNQMPYAFSCMMAFLIAILLGTIVYELDRVAQTKIGDFQYGL